MKAEDLFHLGIVTDKPEATRMELRAPFGYEWGDEIGADHRPRDLGWAGPERLSRGAAEAH
jgi:hypothetical protein